MAHSLMPKTARNMPIRPAMKQHDSATPHGTSYREARKQAKRQADNAEVLSLLVVVLFEKGFESKSKCKKKRESDDRAYLVQHHAVGEVGRQTQTRCGEKGEVSEKAQDKSSDRRRDTRTDDNVLFVHARVAHDLRIDGEDVPRHQKTRKPGKDFAGNGAATRGNLEVVVHADAQRLLWLLLLLLGGVEVGMGMPVAVAAVPARRRSRGARGRAAGGGGGRGERLRVVRVTSHRLGVVVLRLRLGLAIERSLLVLLQDWIACAAHRLVGRRQWLLLLRLLGKVLRVGLRRLQVLTTKLCMLLLLLLQLLLRVVIFCRGRRR